MEHQENRPHLKPKKPLPRGILALVAVLAVAFIALAIPLFGLLNPAQTPPQDNVQENTVDTGPTTIRISLVGDVALADGWGADIAHNSEGSVAAAFAPDILGHLQDSDISYANHEFTMSNRGEALSKYYTICANPAYAGYWRQLGVDIVGLGNNHAYDYGEEAFLDTLDILQSEGIDYVGAGRNLSEAMSPVYYVIDGYKIAFVAADRSQKGDEIRAQSAAEGTPGVLFCFDDELFLAAVARASEIADFVVAIPHWGTEMSTQLEEVQIDLSRKLIDAGADAVVGSHPHVLQGVEFYNGKLIAYSLGNFWFNDETTPTMILDIEITEGQASFRVIPALQTGQMVLASEEISADVFALMRELSPLTTIDDYGYLSAL